MNNLQKEISPELNNLILKKISFGNWVDVCQVKDVRGGTPQWMATMGLPVNGVIPDESETDPTIRWKTLTVANAMEDLDLPLPVALHSVFNRGLTYDDLVQKYGRPENKTKSLILPLAGPSFVGKTKLKKELIALGFETVNFDIFTSDDADRNKDQNNFGECMDKLCSLYEGGKRPEKVVIDKGGFYLDDSKLRVGGIFDLFVEYGMTTIMPVPFTEDGIDAFGKPLDEEVFSQVLHGYLDDLNLKLDSIKAMDHHWQSIFLSAFRGDYPGAAAAYVEWYDAACKVSEQQFDNLP